MSKNFVNNMSNKGFLQVLSANPNANSSRTVRPTQVAPFFRSHDTTTAVWLAGSCVLFQSGFPYPAATKPSISKLQMTNTHNPNPKKKKEVSIEG